MRKRARSLRISDRGWKWILGIALFVSVLVVTGFTVLDHAPNLYLNIPPATDEGNEGVVEERTPNTSPNRVETDEETESKEKIGTSTWVPHSEENIDTSNWLTYTNEKYGFEISYPNTWTYNENWGLWHSIPSIVTLISTKTKRAIEFPTNPKYLTPEKSDEISIYFYPNHQDSKFIGPNVLSCALGWPEEWQRHILTSISNQRQFFHTFTTRACRPLNAGAFGSSMFKIFLIGR